MLERVLIIVLLVTLSLNFSCSRGDGKAATRPRPNSEKDKGGGDDKIDPVKPNPNQPEALLYGVENNYIVIDKRVIEAKPLFLMQTSVIDGKPTPMGRSKANKLVYFEKRGSSIFLFESVEWNVNTNSLPTKHLLAQFPIIKESEDKLSYVFDFGVGMKEILIKEAMFTTDFREDGDMDDTPLHASKSFIDKIEIRGEYLFIDQYISYAEKLKSGKVIQKTKQLKYSLSMYKGPNKEFEPVVSLLTAPKNLDFLDAPIEDYNRIGYFENPPLTVPKIGKEIVHIIKYPIIKDGKLKPITFYISRNVPDQHLQAVKDGILYWNSVFEKDIMRVKILPEGISVHEPGYNIIQWIDWDGAGFAYAQAQADPYTGENLQSHVYMTSVFATNSYKRAYDYLIKLAADAAEGKVKTNNFKNKTSVGLENFKNSKSCYRDFNLEMASGAQAVVAQLKQVPDMKLARKIALRFVNDYVREVVAHEVGHTMGLRHNFSASLSSTVTPQTYDEVQKAYFYNETTGEMGDLIGGVVAASTVMDYVPTMMAVYNGAHIRLKRDGLKYDKAAIAWGYLGKSIAEANPPIFCTDSLLMKDIYHDCKVWDSFKNPVADANFQLHDGVKTIAYQLAKKFQFLLEEPVDEDGFPVELDEVARINMINKLVFHPKKNVTKYIAPPIKALADMASDKAQFITVRKEFTEISEYNLSEYRNKTKDYQRKNFDNAGGLKRVIVNDIISSLKNKNKIQLSRELTKHFNKYFNVAAANSEYVTPAIKEAVSKSFNRYMKFFERESILAYTKVMRIQFGPYTDIIDDVPLREAKRSNRYKTSLEYGLTKALTRILFAKSKREIGTTNQGQIIYRPEYTYHSQNSEKKDIELRAEVISLANNNFYPANPRMRERITTSIMEQHKTQMKDLGINGQDDLSRIEDENIYNWIMSEQKLFQKLK